MTVTLPLLIEPEERLVVSQQCGHCPVKTSRARIEKPERTIVQFHLDQGSRPGRESPLPERLRSIYISHEKARLPGCEFLQLPHLPCRDETLDERQYNK